MHLTQILKSLYLQPKLLLKSENIFLISHMRGNTSLLSHLLGNHPEIEGYYEMHIGYHSWKSLYRQKLLYLQDHTLKPDSRYFFDKILHNDHYIDKKILENAHSKVIIMLREPEQTIRSIVNLYNKIDPAHPHCEAKNATQYYIERLQGIQLMAQRVPNKYYYLQADELKNQTDQTLLSIKQYLDLKNKISEEYASFKNTGKEKYGDSSNNIHTGKIQKKVTDYSSIKLDDQLLEASIRTYRQVNAFLKQNGANNTE